MPSNIIAINGVAEYNVPDRNMEGLIEWLRVNARSLTKGIRHKLKGKYIPQVAYSD